MEELARQMDELGMVLKARTEAGQKAEALAREVQALPKLPGLSSSDANLGSKEHEDLLEKLQLQLELQNLSHAKQQALHLLDGTLQAVAQIRQAVSSTASALDCQSFQVLHNIGYRIQCEKMVYAELQQQKQDLLFKMTKEAAKLEKLQQKLDAVVQ